jgi:hypothetical protein
MRKEEGGNKKKERKIMKVDRRGDKRRYKRGKKIEENGHAPPCGGGLKQITSPRQECRNHAPCE